ncbi:MAG TPA: methyltransferase domain-containing protein [Kofleriaceae bacterium]|nr:methyltransferase domain-containing protein [Kofleriaceae bacterium]
MRPADLLLRTLSSASDEDRAAWRRLLARVGPTTLASWLSPPAVMAATLADTAFAAAMLEALRGDGPAGAALTAAFPEAAALAAPMPPQVEHDAGSELPLLDHIATRLLGRKLLGLETRDRARFQDRGLSPEAFDALAGTCARVLATGLGPALRAAILHLDIAKTRSPIHRAAWASQGIALDVHNEAAAAILRHADRARGWPLPEVLGKLAVAWVEAHGLAGQHVRGEGPLAMYAPLVGTLRDLLPALGRTLELPPAEAVALVLDALHVLDACDTAAVREGLLDDALLARLARVRDQLASVCRPGAWTAPRLALGALAQPLDRAGLADRLRALRAGRQAAGEPAAAVDSAVAALADPELVELTSALGTCQLWYCEAATGGLSPAAQLAVLAAAVGAARAAGIDVSRPWHAQLHPLVARLSGASPVVRYRLRLVEAALAGTPIRALLDGASRLAPLGTLSSRLAHPLDPDAPDAIVIDYLDTEESAALVTLLALYETRSQASYHAMLKALCDLYGLRKDQFDRVANEANYLAAMNAARSDKQRMLELLHPGGSGGPGRIVEVGPGGGVVLDLLAERFPGSEIIGVDRSRDVVDALGQRARARGSRWRVVHGDAEQLGELVGGPLDGVVFCSVLHEVYSYTEPRFSLASIQRVIQGAFAALGPGGRIVIRDGVKPPPGRRRMRMIAPDARDTFELFVAQFEGRPIECAALPGEPDRVELSTADAMEFLYTYTWGPASFPYEVRELYGVLTYDDYVAHLVSWCGGEAAARVIELPPEVRSYLQPGYRDHLHGKIELTDERDRPVELPDSNCLIAIEKRA